MVLSVGVDTQKLENRFVCLLFYVLFQIVPVFDYFVYEQGREADEPQKTDPEKDFLIEALLFHIYLLVVCRL